jgi:hypothetical protein
LRRGYFAAVRTHTEQAVEIMWSPTEDSADYVLAETWVLTLDAAPKVKAVELDMVCALCLFALGFGTMCSDNVAFSC